MRDGSVARAAALAASLPAARRRRGCPPPPPASAPEAPAAPEAPGLGVDSPEALAELLARRAPRLAAHHRAVAELAAAVGLAVGLGDAALAELVRAAGLHDIGKIALPPEILNKRGALDARELELMREHTVVGHRLLAASAELRPIAALVRATHERWDGSGYPDGLRGEEIPLGARIITICDAYDAMTHDRPYRAARSAHEALHEVRRGAGRRYDPRLVPVFAAAAGRLSG